VSPQRVLRQRRDNGDGSLYFDEAKQRWVGQLDLGTDAAGRRVRPRVSAKTKTEARARLDVLRQAHGAGQDLTARTTTFTELAQLWLERGLPPGVSPSTRANYTSLLNQHVLPAFGHRKVTDLRPEDVEQLLDQMANNGYAGRSVRLTLGLIRRILRLGERRSIVIRNVASVVEAPPAGPASVRAGLTPDQAVSLLLGLRPGEAAGLSWRAVDLESEPATLTVSHSLRRDGKLLTLVQPKTPTSHRTLALPQTCTQALTRQRDLQAQDQRLAGRRWHNTDALVFTNELGGPLDPSNVRRALTRLAHQAGLGHVHPHLLRHAAASLMSDAGVSIEQISDTLGHRSINVTAEIYRHPINPIRTGHLAAMNQLSQPDTEPAASAS
jgi:integrase